MCLHPFAPLPLLSCNDGEYLVHAMNAAAAAAAAEYQSQQIERSFLYPFFKLQLMFVSGPEISHLNLQSYFGRRSEGRGRSRQLQTDSMRFCTSEYLRSGDALMDSVGYCQSPSRHHNCRNDESLKSSFLAFCLEIDAGGPAASPHHLLQKQCDQCSFSHSSSCRSSSNVSGGIKVVVIPEGVLRWAGGEGNWPCDGGRQPQSAF